jgi:hypothetical protein
VQYQAAPQGDDLFGPFPRLPLWLRFLPTADQKSFTLKFFEVFKLKISGRESITPCPRAIEIPTPALTCRKQKRIVHANSWCAKVSRECVSPEALALVLQLSISKAFPAFQLT